MTATGFVEGIAAAIEEITAVCQEMQAKGDTHAVFVCALLAQRVGARERS